MKWKMTMVRTTILCLTAMLIATIILCINAYVVKLTDTEAEEIQSDGLESNMFSLDGVIYAFPVRFSEFAADGWEPYEIENYNIEPGEFDVWGLANADRMVSVAVSNFSNEAILGNEGYITGVVSYAPFTNADLVIPGDITLGSTYDDVIATYKNPIFDFDYEAHRALHFEVTDDISVRVYIEVESNLVVFISMDYYFGSGPQRD